MILKYTQPVSEILVEKKTFLVTWWLNTTQSWKTPMSDIDPGVILNST